MREAATHRPLGARAQAWSLCSISWPLGLVAWEREEASGTLSQPNSVSWLFGLVA